MSAVVVVGDCVEVMAGMPAGSVDAIVTDPPYGLEFMGKDWDRLSGQPGYVERGRITERPDAQVPYGRGGGVNSYQAGQPMQEWHERWAREALRVLRPGGHLLAFGGTRTYHRLACAVEDAGFEIRDCVSMWVYGSGFPKSLDVSKAMIDTADAARWDGWGTALKPAWEPVVVARKPLVGTVAANVLAHGTGALNIDACRVGFAGEADERESKQKNRHGDFDSAPRNDGTAGIYGADLRGGAERGNYDPTGRWPANVVLSHTEDCVMVGQREARSNGHFPSSRGPSGYGAADGSNAGGLHGQDALVERRLAGELVGVWECAPGCPVRLLDEQTGDMRARGNVNPTTAGGGLYGLPIIAADHGAGDAGGASRFFYTAKASRAERDAGLREGLPRARRARKRAQQDAADRWWPRASNRHPTVKPIDVMRWLVRLVTPPGGRVLDPFAGSGTTGCAAVLEGFEFVGVERDRAYVVVAEARIRFWREHPTGLPVEQALEAEGKRRRARESGQLGFEL